MGKKTARNECHWKRRDRKLNGLGRTELARFRLSSVERQATALLHSYQWTMAHAFCVPMVMVCVLILGSVTKVYEFSKGSTIG